MLSHEEAQELHLLIGGPLEEARQNGAFDPEYVMVKASDLERARELAALLVSDTDPDNEDEAEHERKFADGSRVVWDGDGEETYGTVSGYTAEEDVYLVDFDGCKARTPAYGHELRQA